MAGLAGHLIPSWMKTACRREYSLRYTWATNLSRPALSKSLNIAGPTGGYFGEITFAEDMTDDREPVSLLPGSSTLASTVLRPLLVSRREPRPVVGRQWVQNGETTNYTGDVESGREPGRRSDVSQFDAPEGQVIAFGDYGSIDIWMASRFGAPLSWLKRDRVPGRLPGQRISSTPTSCSAWYRLASCLSPYHPRIGPGHAEVSYPHGIRRCRPGQCDVQIQWRQMQHRARQGGRVPRGMESNSPGGCIQDRP